MSHAGWAAIVMIGGRAGRIASFVKSGIQPLASPCAGAQGAAARGGQRGVPGADSQSPSSPSSQAIRSRTPA
ncbi:hypothetical protein BN1110_06258 [bacterium YEK0313]|nr:hypothetical protein BN1110_06258 [bacterium YEK0313]